MPVFVRKLYYLILNRRAIPRASAFDLAGIEGRFRYIISDRFMDSVCGVAYVARKLLLMTGTELRRVLPS